MFGTLPPMPEPDVVSGASSWNRSPSSAVASPVSPRPTRWPSAASPSPCSNSTATLRWRLPSPTAASCRHRMPKSGTTARRSSRASSGCCATTRPCWSTPSRAGTSCPGLPNSSAPFPTTAAIPPTPPVWRSRPANTCSRGLQRRASTSTSSTRASCTSTATRPASSTPPKSAACWPEAGFSAARSHPSKCGRSNRPWPAPTTAASIPTATPPATSTSTPSASPPLPSGSV